MSLLKTINILFYNLNYNIVQIMINTIKIQFIRKNKNDVGIYTASSLMNNKIQMLYKWLYNKKTTN